MTAARLTPKERQQVKKLLHQLAERVDGGWEGLIRLAGIPPSTAQAWRYGKTPVTPESPHLLRLLRAAGVFGPGFELPTGSAGLPAPVEADAVLGQALEEIAGVLERLVSRVSEQGPQDNAETGSSPG